MSGPQPITPFLDGKLGADGNALFRQPDLREMRDQSQEDPREAQAAQWELNYVALDGNIGCMVNGAGLAMGTINIVMGNGPCSTSTSNTTFWPGLILRSGAPLSNVICI